MKKSKKILAFVAAMAMVMAPTATWADQSPAQSTGEAGNTGSVEGVVDKNYVSYIAPTVSDNTFDFVLDPQLLMENTDGSSIKGNASVATEAGVSVYFKNGSTYAASSDALTVTNKGSGELSVSVNATLELDATGASVSIVTDSAAVATGSGLNLRIHLDQVTGGAATASLEEDADSTTKSALSLEVTAAGADADEFEVTKTAGKYEYAPKNDDVSGDSVGFVFYGECNTNDDADWSSVEDMNATFSVVWDIKSSSGTTVIYAAPFGSNFFAGLSNESPFPEGFPSNAKLSDLSEVTFINQSTGEVYDGLDLGIVSFDSTTVEGKTYLKINAGAKSNVTWTLNFTYLGRSYTSELEY